MRFAVRLAVKNIKRRPLRTVLLWVIVLMLSLTTFLGGYLIISLQNGLSGYQARLGADVIVVPSSAQGHGTVEDVLLQGITGNYYLPVNSLTKLSAIEGIERQSEQFYLTSAKASCCSARVQIIGFDPTTDFTILPWMSGTAVTSLSHGEVVIGANIAYPADGRLRFYGESYRVAGQLDSTGTGLDNAVFTDRATIKQMALSAADTLERDSLKGIDIERAASCVLLKLRNGYDAQAVADDINLHVSKVKATPSRSMIASVADGFQGVSALIGWLTIGIWVVAGGILIAVFVLLSHERKKEFAVLRVVGASRRVLLLSMGTEAALVSAAGAVTGWLLSLLLMTPVAEGIRETLSLPFLSPNSGLLVLLSIGAVMVPLLVGLLTAVTAAERITKNETGLLLREDA